MILSVSQVERFDHKQKYGCERASWFERLQGLKPDESASQAEGTSGHDLLATWFSKGLKPEKRVKMGKAVTGAIVKGDLPTPGPDMLVEHRFDGGPKHGPGCKCGHGPHENAVCPNAQCPCTIHEPEWRPVDEEKTLRIGGSPWDGFIDLTYRRDDVPVVLDHKFTADPTFESALRPDQLVKTVQLPVYVMAMQRKWPDAKLWSIGHHNVSKKGVASLIRSAVVSNDEIAERRADIEGLVGRMIEAAKIETQDDIPFNKRACEIRGPSGFMSACPHQSICRAYREKNKVSMTAEELALFGEVTPPAKAPETPPDPKPHRMQFVDVPADPKPALEAPTEPSRTPPEQKPVCACSAELTPENASKLRSGEWKHIGCPLEAPAEPPKAEPIQVAPEEAEPIQVAPEEAAAATKLLPATESKPAEHPGSVLGHLDLTVSPHLDLTVSPMLRAGAIADVLESIARLLRS